mgnify:CR=1 FL=1
MVRLEKVRYILNLKEYNESRLLAADIVTGKEYRRILRKEKRKRL